MKNKRSKQKNLKPFFFLVLHLATNSKATFLGKRPFSRCSAIMCNEWFIWIKNCHHQERFASFYYMFLRICEVDSDVIVGITVYNGAHTWLYLLNFEL